MPAPRTATTQPAAAMPPLDAALAATTPEPERYATIIVSLADDQEPVRQYVAFNGRDWLIQRGKPVKVPMPLLEVLDNAVKGVPEKDEMDPDKVMWTERKRFPYTVVELH